MAHLQFLLKNESRVPVLPPWERCLLVGGPDWPLVFVLPREDWAVPAAPTLRAFIEALEEGEETVDEEEGMVAEPVDEESEFCRSRAK